MSKIALYKLCRCGKRIEYIDKHCEECTATVAEEKKDRVRKYDREVRYSKENKRYADFYHSPAWLNLSEIIKLNFLGMCTICATENINDAIKLEVTNSDTTHHIVELKENWDLRLVEDNLIPLCHYHHNKIHANYCEKDRRYLRDTIMKFKTLYL